MLLLKKIHSSLSVSVVIVTTESLTIFVSISYSAYFSFCDIQSAKLETRKKYHIHSRAIRLSAGKILQCKQPQKFLGQCDNNLVHFVARYAPNME